MGGGIPTPQFSLVRSLHNPILSLLLSCLGRLIFIMSRSISQTCLSVGITFIV
jgi:hypothetical protein